MDRHDLTDFEWSVIEPLLPQKSRGVARSVVIEKFVRSFALAFAPTSLG